jgi:Spy/CpxP family protein refolding chaperone
MKQTKVLFIALTLCAACDNAEPATTAQPQDVAEAEADPEDDAEIDGFRDKRHAGKHWDKHEGDLADRLCDKLECTDDQHEKVVELFDGDRPHRERPASSGANKALADAFRGDAFSKADVEAYTTAVRPGGDRGAREAEKLQKLHAILTADQRERLAEKIEDHGFLAGGHGKPHGRWGKHADKDARKDGSGAEHRVERMCEPLSCSDAQKKELAAIVGKAKAGHGADEPTGEIRKALADAMRAETFDSAAVTKALSNGKAQHEEHEAARVDGMIAIHGVLDAKQRTMVADRIEEFGAGALLGGPGKRGRHGKHDRGDKRGKPEGRRFERG